MEKALTRLDLTVPDKSYDLVTGLLTLMFSYGWEEQSLTSGDTLFRVHCEDAGHIEDIRQTIQAQVPEARLETGSVVERDWLSSWKEFFTPVLCGSRFVVLPPWLEEQASSDWPGRQAVYIEPKSAFGTGHHATTALCLEALSDLLDEGRIKAGQTFLDLGTGSGVLGLGLALSGLSGTGLDIDPLAVGNAFENRALNKVAEGRLSLALGSVDGAAGKSFDVVVANILARPLIVMAPAVAACKAGGGVLVLSGILGIQADSVAAAYQACGLGEPQKRQSGEWAALVWK